MHGGQEIDQAALADLHTFRIAGGAGGIDDIGQVLGDAQQCPRVPAPIYIAQLRRQHDITVKMIQLCLNVITGDQHPSGGILQHVLEPLRREMGIEGHEGGTDFPHRQQCGHQVRAAFQADGNKVPRKGTPLDERVRQGIGARIELLEGEGNVACQQGFPIARQLHLPLEQLRHRRVAGKSPVGVIALADEALALRLVEYGQIGYRKTRLGDGAREQLDKIAREALHTLAFEACTAVFDIAGQAPVGLQH